MKTYRIIQLNETNFIIQVKRYFFFWKTIAVAETAESAKEKLNKLHAFEIEQEKEERMKKFPKKIVDESSYHYCGIIPKP